MMQPKEKVQKIDRQVKRSRPARRTPRACDRCRLRKAKCDGQRPCRTCTDMEADCVYAAWRTRDAKKHLLKMQDVLEAAVQQLYRATVDGECFPGNPPVPRDAEDSKESTIAILQALGYEWPLLDETRPETCSKAISPSPMSVDSVASALAPNSRAVSSPRPRMPSTHLSPIRPTSQAPLDTSLKLPAPKAIADKEENMVEQFQSAVACQQSDQQSVPSLNPGSWRHTSGPVGDDLFFDFNHYSEDTAVGDPPLSTKNNIFPYPPSDYLSGLSTHSVPSEPLIHDSSISPISQASTLRAERDFTDDPSILKRMASFTPTPGLYNKSASAKMDFHRPSSHNFGDWDVAAVGGEPWLVQA